MKVIIDETLTGKELYNYLVANKQQLIAQKKSSIKTTDTVSYNPEYYTVKEKTSVKTLITDIPEEATKVRVKIVGNSAWWFDSQQDVLLPDCWNKSIKDGNGRLHLKDHTYKLEAEIGDVFNIYPQDVSLTDLGLNISGTTQALIYESDVQKSYDEKTFNKYRKGKINQHSIGLNYKNILMAINDEDYKEEFATWNKYIDRIINREDAEKRGYMWIVPEIKLIEVSAVLLGANELTPTLEVGKNTFAQPEPSTVEEPSNEPVFDWSAAIKTTNFFNI